MFWNSGFQSSSLGDPLPTPTKLTRTRYSFMDMCVRKTDLDLEGLKSFFSHQSLYEKRRFFTTFFREIALEW